MHSNKKVIANYREKQSIYHPEVQERLLPIVSNRGLAMRKYPYLPLTLHNVFTIRSAFAGVIKALSNEFATLDVFGRPKVRLVTSAAVPKPSPTIKLPNEVTLANLDAGTALSFALSSN